MDGEPLGSLVRPRRRSSLCHHVLLPLVEADLAEGDGAHHHVDASGDEAVDAHLVVEAVDVLGRVFTVEEIVDSLLTELKLSRGRRVAFIFLKIM